jgi:hypothetical protein
MSIANAWDQRAFRQRKEGYIKKLEQQVRDFMEMKQSFETLQSENYTLREYVNDLESRLRDALGEFPQPPPNVNLSQPPLPLTSGPEDVPSSAVGYPLEAGPAAQEQMSERQQNAFQSPQGAEDTQTTDEINLRRKMEGLAEAIRQAR